MKRYTYPFAQMKVGDEFVVPLGRVAACRASATYFRKKNPGYEFEIARHGDGEYHCRRIAGRVRATVSLIADEDRPELDPALEMVLDDMEQVPMGPMRAGQWFVVPEWRMGEVRNRAIALNEKFDGRYVIFQRGDDMVCVCTQQADLSKERRPAVPVVVRAAESAPPVAIGPIDLGDD